MPLISSWRRGHSVTDLYLYDDVPVLKNKLGIKDDKTLELVEAEQSRVNMMLLYERGFDDFSPDGLREIHRVLFGDIYDWAGEYRLINIEKRESLLGGRSVWYSNDDTIADDLASVFREIRSKDWQQMTREEFVHAPAHLFPKIWRVHPFREENTRTVVMMMTFFVEYYGYYMDQELMAASAGYVRNSFVMASIDPYSEYEHLEKILLDAVCDEPINYDDASLYTSEPTHADREKYKEYQKEKYEPQPHYQR